MSVANGGGDATSGEEEDPYLTTDNDNDGDADEADGAGAAEVVHPHLVLPHWLRDSWAAEVLRFERFNIRTCSCAPRFL